jgi:DNA invertase Pin-like site-specific DNA recombinase
MIGFIESQKAEEERKRHIQRTKHGIEAFKEEHGRWGPEKKYGTTSDGKPIDKNRFWFLYETYRMSNVSKSAIARILDISRPTLYKRLKEEPEKYNNIEEKVKEKYGAG